MSKELQQELESMSGKEILEYCRKAENPLFVMEALIKSEDPKAHDILARKIAECISFEEATRRFPKAHELLGLEEGVQRAYVVYTGHARRPADPHASIIIAGTLKEAERHFKDAVLSDIQAGCFEGNWIMLHDLLMPSIREQTVEMGKFIASGPDEPMFSGRLQIRGEFTNPQEGAMLCYGRIKHAAIKHADEMAKHYGTEFGLSFSKLAPGYVADFFAPICRFPRR